MKLLANPIFINAGSTTYNATEPPMTTISIDHIAMPTANAERLLEFYKRIGLCHQRGR